MTTDISEKSLETLIIESLVSAAGYDQGHSEDYDRDHARDLAKLQAFIGTTHPATTTGPLLVPLQRWREGGSHLGARVPTYVGKACGSESMSPSV